MYRPAFAAGRSQWPRGAAAGTSCWSDAGEDRRSALATPQRRNNVPELPGKVFYVTTPIYYVNARPHIGHAYTTVAADVIARYWRLRGREVLFATGTDEHGEKNRRSAEQRGLRPQQYVDEMSALYQQAWSDFHIQYDRFIRTSEAQHIEVVQRVFEQLRDSGDIYLGTYEGWYCVACESYYREDELVEGKCPDCGRDVERVSEPAYFFRTSKYAEALLAHIHANPNFILPEQRRNEVISFIESGLLDACVSRRRSDWDIPVPGDESQTIYVWFDALVNYLTVAGYGHDEEKFASVWPPDLQLMGKDILPRFHATLWPAMLMALGLELPRTLFAHGWWMAAADDRSGLTKISKSKGNVIDPLQSARLVAQVSGADLEIAIDAVRYYMLREVTFGLDGTFSMDNVLERFNADLANDLGNLLNRALPLVARWRNGLLPQVPEGTSGIEPHIVEARQRYEQAMERCDFRRALEVTWEMIGAANKYLDARAPWTLRREGRALEAEAVLYDALDAARCAAIAVWPFMPVAAEEMWRQLGLSAAGIRPSWDDFAPRRLAGDVPIGNARPIFPRIDMSRIDAKAPQTAGEPKHEEAGEEKRAPMITFEEFRRLDLRAAKVLQVERVPGTDKLLLLSVDVGEGSPRQIVAGLAPNFGPEDLIGKTVVVVANLEPARIRGVESQGMILAAGEKEPLGLVVVDPECAPGTKVR
ncbi:MAG: methionine--tRNA ligase [Armatimonadetes bacterium]|nr:methionine--tRNA ligase [Armatimonadota bacterium]